MNKLFIISYPLGYNGTRFSKMLHTSDSFYKRYIHTNLCYDLNIQPDEPLRLESIRLIKEEVKKRNVVLYSHSSIHEWITYFPKATYIIMYRSYDNSFPVWNWIQDPDNVVDKKTFDAKNKIHILNRIYINLQYLQRNLINISKYKTNIVTVNCHELYDAENIAYLQRIFKKLDISFGVRGATGITIDHYMNDVAQLNKIRNKMPKIYSKIESTQ